MKIYNFDATTGEFLTESVADADPREPSNWLIPAFATKNAPTFKAGFTPFYENDIWVLKPIVVPPAPTLAELKTVKKAEISTSFEKTMQQITTGYSPNEIASWSKQEQEARAFTAVALSPTPLIDALANTRGVPKAALSARIIAKADFFAGISGQLIGKRQGLEDSVDAATSKTALAAINW